MARTPGDRTRMEDIAKLAGVAKITVSRALRDSPLVRPEVRERVKRIALNAGYRLNTAARNLRLQRTQSITAVIETDAGNERSVGEPLVQMIIGGMLETLAAARYQLVITTRSMFQQYGATDADGIIVAGQGADDESARYARSFGLPTVVWGVNPGTDNDSVYVCSDHVEGGRLVGLHLLELKRQNVVFLGDVSHPEIHERARGLKTTLGRKARCRIVPCAFTRSAGHEAMLDVLSRFPETDAIAAASDMIAVGAIDALRARYLSVPDDVAVVGYDDIIAEANLTSVRQEWTLAGATLAKKMIELVERRRAKSVRLPVRLVVRSSSCSAGARTS